MLDHYGIWDSPLPQNNHGELLAAAISACFITPTVELFYFIDRKLKWYPDSPDWWKLIILFVLLPGMVCGGVAVGAAIVHAFDGFQYVTPVRVLAVYGFGSIILFPSCILAHLCFEGARDVIKYW
jgi:hypothetical protein